MGTGGSIQIASCCSVPGCKFSFFLVQAIYLRTGCQKVHLQLVRWDCCKQAGRRWSSSWIGLDWMDGLDIGWCMRERIETAPLHTLHLYNSTWQKILCMHLPQLSTVQLVCTTALHLLQVPHWTSKEGTSQVVRGSRNGSESSQQAGTLQHKMAAAIHPCLPRLHTAHLELVRYSTDDMQLN